MWLAHRLRRPARPPRGTRPVVRLTFEGVTYDVSDQLYRIRDTDTGNAQWLILGPQHIRLVQGCQMTFKMKEPVPKKTSLEMLVVRTDEGEGRFASLSEMSHVWPEIAE